MKDTTSRSYYKQLSKEMSAKNAELEKQSDDAIHFALNTHEDILNLKRQLAGDCAWQENDLREHKAEIKTLKSIGAEYWQTLCHYDHDGISTPWPYSTGGNRQSSAIEQLADALFINKGLHKQLHDRIAESVPFAVVRCEMDGCLGCAEWKGKIGCEVYTKQHCPLLKGKA